MSISDAIKDLKSSIEVEGFKPELIVETASDWGLNPALLARKFEESAGKPASEWSAPKKVEISREYLLDQARAQWKANYLSGNPDDYPLFGKEFEDGGQHFIATAYVGENRILCIRAANGERWQFTFNRKAGLAKWVERVLGVI